MPTAVAAIIICQSTDEKKRKGATASDNDERSVPPKKKGRYKCSADGCSNKVITGGVCIRHGAKEERKRCHVDRCTNYSVTRGVCKRHWAKVERKRCSVGGCPKQVQRRGVCYRHMYSYGTPRANIQVQNNLGRDDGNTASATPHDAGGTQSRGVGRKGKVASEKQSNTLTSNNSVGEKVEIISDDEDGEKKQSPIARRTRKAGSNKQSETTSNGTRDKESDESETEITGNKDAVEGRKSNESVKSFAGGENLKDDEERDVSPRKRTRGEANLKDDKVQDTSDLASTQEGGRGGTSRDAMEDDNSWGGDGQNEYDCGDDNGDIYSERELQSHVVPEEITTAGANDDGKEREIQRLTAELKRLNERVEELEGAQSRSKTEHERQHSELKDLRAKMKEKTEDVARLEASLRSKDLEMESQVHTSAAQLKEANDKVEALSTESAALRANLREATRNDELLKSRLKEMTDRHSDAVTQVERKSEAIDGLNEELEELKEAANAKLEKVTQKLKAAEPFWKTWGEKNKLQAKLNGTKSQLKKKSDAVVKLKGEVEELKVLIASLENQLKEKVQVKEEELTDDEDFTARLKGKRAHEVAVNAKMKEMAAKVDFATSEQAKLEFAFEEAKAKIKELQAKATIEKKPFKVRFSQRIKKQEREKRG